MWNEEQKCPVVIWFNVILGKFEFSQMETSLYVDGFVYLF